MRRDFSKWEVLCAAPFIKEMEGLKLEAYICPAGKPTIGYGHTGDVQLGTRITKEDADKMLTLDLEKFKAQVRKYVHVQVTKGQFIALLDFAFNLGSRSLITSTLLKKLNDGDVRGAADEFPKWVHASGKVLPGLVKRRAKEREFFLNETR